MAKPSGLFLRIPRRREDPPEPEIIKMLVKISKEMSGQTEACETNQDSGISYNKLQPY